MQRKFVTNLILLLFLNLLVKPFWILGIDREVQNTVGAEEYGLYFALFNLSLILNIFLDIGITNFNNRNISQNNQLLSKHLSGIILLRFLLAALYCIILFGAAFIIGYDKRQFFMLALLGFNQFLLSFILYLRSNVAGLQLFRTDSLLSVLDRLLMIIICAVLLYGNVFDQKFQIEWFIYAQTAGYLLTAAVAFLVVLSKSEFLKLTWNPVFFRLILRQSLPYALLVLLMSFYNRIDSVMLERMLGDKGAIQSGIYAQAYRLLDAGNMIAFLFAGLLLPMFSKMLKAREDIRSLTGLAIRLLIAPSIIVAFIGSFYSHQIMNLLYDEYAVSSAPVFAILMFGFIPVCSTYIFGTLLTANGSLRQLNIIAATSMLINIGLNLLLIPILEVKGAAITSLTTQSINVILQLIVVILIFKIKPSIRFLLRFALFTISVGMITYGSTFLSIDWMIRLVLASTACLALALITNIISIKGLYRIVRYDS